MTKSSLPPVGWYNDPEGSGVRWWDGTRWTEHVQTAGQASEAMTGQGNVAHSIRHRRWDSWLLAAVVAILLVGGAAFYIVSSQGSSPTPNPSLTLTVKERGLIRTVFDSFSRYCHNGYEEGIIALTPLATRLTALAREKPMARYSSGGRSRSMSDVVADAASTIDPATCNLFGSPNSGVPTDQTRAYDLLNRESLRGR